MEKVHREALGADSKERPEEETAEEVLSNSVKGLHTAVEPCLLADVHTCRDATTRTFLFVSGADKRKVARLNESGHFAPLITDLGVS